MISAWDFVSCFSAILGLCPTLALECHALAESKHPTEPELLISRPKAPYAASITLDEFLNVSLFLVLFFCTPCFRRQTTDFLFRAK